MGRPRKLSDAERKLRKNEWQKKSRKDPKNETGKKRDEYRSRPDVKINERVRVSTYNRINALIPKNKDRRNANRRNQSDEERAETNRVRNIYRNENYDNLKQAVYKMLGGCKGVECKRCEYNVNPLALDIDHIHDTGNLDDKRFSRDEIMFSYYLRHYNEALDNLQLLCANCNQIKEYERKKALKKSDIPRNIKNREDYQKSKNLAFEILGGYICSNVECGFNDHRSLHIDHIHGDGRLDRDNRSRQNNFFRFIITNSDEVKKKLQILCANCNQIKARTT